MDLSWKRQAMAENRRLRQNGEKQVVVQRKIEVSEAKGEHDEAG